MPDNLENLPTNKNKISENEQNTANYLFKDDKSLKNRVVSNFKEVLIAGILFFIISLKIVDTLIDKYIKIDNNYITILIKSSIFMILFLILKTFFV